MALDLSGRLLEGIRISTGNNSLTFPPRSLISDQTTFDSPTTRAEYAIIVDSLDTTKYSLEIVDSDLIFRVTKNESVAVRFDYDNFSRRFSPMPGGGPDAIGPISNSPRLSIPAPDFSLSDAPITVFVGNTVRVITFNISQVPTESDFTDPSLLSVGVVEVSEEDGKLNFSTIDVNTYLDQIIYATKQTFLDRKQSTGQVGRLPQSSLIDYFIYINPKPASGQIPLIKIDYQRYLIAVEVPNEASLGSPADGTFTWALDTGRIRFSVNDVDSYLNRPVYYDGVFTQSVQLTKTIVGLISGSYPVPAFVIANAVGNTDPYRFVIAAELNGIRFYFPVTIIDITDPPSSQPPPGTVYLDSITGAVFLRNTDSMVFATWSFLYVDTVVEIEDGVSVQFYRSGVNGSGVPSSPDFMVVYTVDEQIIESKITASPFLMLPTTPIIDSYLNYRVSPGIGSTGSFSDDLVDGTDPTTQGFGYLFNLDRHLFQFSNRKTTSTTLLKPTSVIKLDDAAISEYGFEISKNGVLLFKSNSAPGGSSLTPGVDFVFNSANGTVEFIGPVGENDPNNILGIIGVVSSSFVLPLISSLNVFTADSQVFTGNDVGKYLLVSSGDNVGIYQITTFISTYEVKVTPPFISAGSTTADLKSTAEIIADRFWVEFLPPYKKFTLMKANGSSSFSEIDNTEFGVLKTTGQINLKTQSKPDDTYQISYISLDSTDGGVTTTPTNRVETALFKIRQEIATATSTPPATSTPFEISKSRAISPSLYLGIRDNVVSSGPTKYSFNPDGRTVSTLQPMSAYVGGIPLDSDQFSYKAPNIIELNDPVQPGQAVIIDYWVQEAIGGENNFNLLYTPIDVDTPEIIGGQQTATFNADQTNVLSAGSAILINQVEVLIVESLSYDSINDVTNVKFETIPITSSNGAPLQATGSINGSYRETETNSIDVFAQNTNTLHISGNRAPYYPIGTVITVNNDPYLVRSSLYDATIDRTTIITATSASKNYVIPTVTRTIRPVLFPDSSFETKKPLNISFPFTLVQMGNTRSVLVNGVDYTVAEGGTIKLSTAMAFGDSLYITYVYRENQSRLTSFTFNYAYQIAPDIANNGIQGQQLLASYHLYAPDSFFYRVETIESFIPEVQQLLVEGASAGSSGPNTADSSAMATKDYGKASPHFDEQHQYNIDVTVMRLLKYYNDVINIYEDILSDLDGRIVGGNNGKFRFDGKLNNPIRTFYSEVTNDIDDRVVVYVRKILTGFFTFSDVPVYSMMGMANQLSRLFPTYRIVTTAINDLVSFDDFGETMGSLGIENIKKVLYMRSARGRAFFDSVSGGNVFTITSNGNPDQLIPAFEVDQSLYIYSNDGMLSGAGVITDVTGSGPFQITFDGTVALTSGSLLRNTNISDESDPTLSYYTDGADLNVDFDNGQVNNFTLPEPFHSIIQNEVKGNELLDVSIKYNNQNMDPARIPVLDGLELNDDGSVPAPMVRRNGESFLLNLELSVLNQVGSATIANNRIDVVSNVSVDVGYQIKFLSGPNIGMIREVNSITDSTHFTVDPVFPYSDVIGNDIRVYTSSGDQLDTIWDQEIAIIESNTAGPVLPVPLLSSIDSEIISADNAILNLGEQIASGTGNTTSTTILNDPSATFTIDDVDDTCLVYAPTGNNHGLYKINSVTANDITIDGTAPYAEFPVIGSTQYIIIKPYSFMSSRGAEFLTEFLRETLLFLDSTQTFITAPTNAGKTARIDDINTRQSKITTFKDNLSSILSNSDKLYDMRYLWIQQRTNREYGSLVRKLRAELLRQSGIAQLLANQQKLLVVQNL